MLNIIVGLSMKLLWFSIAEGLLGLILLVLSPLWDNRFTVRWKKYLWCVLAVTLLVGPFLPAPQLKVLKFGIGSNDSAINRYPQNDNQGLGENISTDIQASDNPVNTTEPVGSDVNDATDNPTVPGVSINPATPGISVNPTNFDNSASGGDSIIPVTSNNFGTLPGSTDSGDMDDLSLEEISTNEIYRMLPKIIRAFAVIWLMGAALFAAYIFVKEYIFRDSLKRQTQRVCNEETVNIYKSVCREMGINEKMAPKLLAWSDANGPMLAGLFCPKLIMPAEFESMLLNESKSETSELGVKYGDELYYILKHELTHFIGKDLWLKALFLAVNVLHWFNPIVWLICRKANQDIELACDERVLGKLDLNARRIYGEILLLTARKQNRYLAALSTELSGGARVIRDRIKNVFTLNKRKGIIPAAICCLVILLISMAACLSAPQNPTDPSTSTEKQVEIGTNTEEPTTTGIEGIVKNTTESINLSVAAGNRFIIAVSDAGNAVFLPRAIIDKSWVTYPKDMFRGTEVFEEWNNLKQVAADSLTCVLGLKTDGSVLSFDVELSKQEWTDIVSVDMAYGYVIGLKENGTVVFESKYKDGNSEIIQNSVKGWTDIIQVVAGNGYVAGLRHDGTVIAAGSNCFGQCETEDWKDVVMIAAGENHLAGLRSNGTVLASGVRFLGACDVAEWREIVFVDAGEDITVGVKSDGTVIAAGYNINKRCMGAEKWKDMAYVSIGKDVVAGFTNSGKVLIAGAFCEEYDMSVFNNVVMAKAKGLDFNMDFSKQLADVRQTYIDLELADYLEEHYNEAGWGDFIAPERGGLYFEPENGEIKAGSFSFNVPEDIADKICYLRYENGVSMYLKSDIYYDAINYSFPHIASVFREENEISNLWKGITPVYVAGGEEEEKRAWEYIDAVWAEIFAMSGYSEDSSGKLFDQNGQEADWYHRLGLYNEYKDKITAKHTYYLVCTPSDMQLTWEENAEDYFYKMEWFKTSVKIVENTAAK